MVELEKQLFNFLQSEEAVQEILTFYQNANFDFSENLEQILQELSFHPNLLLPKKIALLTNEEYFKTHFIREKGLKTLPKEWWNQEQSKIDDEALHEIWLRPCETDISRNTYLPQEERLQNRLEKLRDSIEKNRKVIFLGRQTGIYRKLHKALNKEFQGKIEFVSDHRWSKAGYVESGVKISDSRLSALQAFETIRRMSDLKLNLENFKPYILCSLDHYDQFHGLSAIYSNPNKIARLELPPAPFQKGELKFSHTGLTDLELANIVRNKTWWDLTEFVRTGLEGQVEFLSKEKVAQEYGIQFIGKLLPA